MSNRWDSLYHCDALTSEEKVETYRRLGARGALTWVDRASVEDRIASYEEDAANNVERCRDAGHTLEEDDCYRAAQEYRAILAEDARLKELVPPELHPTLFGPKP